MSWIGTPARKALEAATLLVEWALTPIGEGSSEDSYATWMASTIHRLRVCLEAGRPLLGGPKQTSSWSAFLHMAALWTYASSARTGHIQLSFCWSGSRKGGGLKACSTTGCGVTEGTLGTYPARGYKKALAIPGAKSKCVGATDRACKSPTLFRDEIARRNTVFRVRWRSVISSIGSNGGLQRASNTTARSQGGIRDRTGGLSLSAPRRKRVTKGCLPTDCPPREAW